MTFMAELTWTTRPPKSVARGFAKLGMIGFWVQLVFLIAVGVLGIYTFAITGSRPGLGGLLAFLGLVLPAFTTFWCWRYARLGRDLETENPGPKPASLHRAAWIGVWVGTVGSVATLLSMFGAASTLLVTMLSNPQIGIQVSPAQGVTAYTVSAIDAVSLMALLLTLTAELLVVAISLRLAFFVTAACRPVAAATAAARAGRRRALPRRAAAQRTSRPRATGSCASRPFS
jgi:hypothetical protein